MKKPVASSQGVKIIFSLIVMLMGVGLGLLGNVVKIREHEAQLEIQLYNDGLKEYRAKNFEEAAALFAQVGTSTKDAELGALALFNLATLNWEAEMGDAAVIIDSYQESLRRSAEPYEPDINRKASIDLEAFYKILQQIELEMQQGVPGEEEGEDVTTGDI